MTNKDGIIILGHPRSGTTLLRRLLNGHSAIACPGETHMLSACARFLRAERTGQGVDMGVLAGLSFAGFDEEDVLASLRDFAFGYFTRYADHQGKRRWAEKTAFDSFFLPEIEQLCGNQAYFVGIVRHGIDVAVSTNDFCQAAGMYLAPLHEYIRRYPHPFEAFAQSWVDNNRQLFEFGERHPDNCVIYRYEDLIEAPEETLGDLLEFVGEEFEPAMLTEGLKAGDTLGFGDHKSYQTSTVHSQSAGRWRDVPEPQLPHLAAIVNPLLELCGYDPVKAAAPPSREDARRRYAMSLMVNAARGTGADSEGGR